VLEKKRAYPPLYLALLYLRWKPNAPFSGLSPLLAGLLTHLHRRSRAHASSTSGRRLLSLRQRYALESARRERSVLHRRSPRTPVFPRNVGAAAVPIVQAIPTRQVSSSPLETQRRWCIVRSSAIYDRTLSYTNVYIGITHYIAGIYKCELATLYDYHSDRQSHRLAM
jgi:hypothetical protein